MIMKQKLMTLFTLLLASVSMSATPPEACEDLGSVQGKATITFTRYAVKYLPGVFSVATGSGSGTKVRFAQGNLQYRAESGVWHFAENQWNYLGTGGGNQTPAAKRESQTQLIDLFGWGTSGATAADFGTGATATCNMPWAVSTNNADYAPGGSTAVSITQGSGYEEADWAWHNKIQNGGNTVHTWRVLSIGEWSYIFRTRTNAANLYGFGKVHGVNGVILLCDGWDWTSSDVNGVDIATAAATANFTWTPGTGAYTNNVISNDLWAVMESAGAVFLPAAGNRSGSTVSSAGSNGRYWSSSRYNETYACYVHFTSGLLNPQYFNDRNCGFAVRPVQGL